MDNQTQVQLYLASHTNDLDYAVAQTAAPALYGGMIIIAIYVLIRILVGIFKHFFVEEDK